MLPKEQELLSLAYQNYLETGKRECGLRFTDSREKSQIRATLNNLQDDGYIEYTASALGFCQFKITSFGIQFAENDFKEPDFIPEISGNNNIIVSGSGNTVSNNYNQLSVDLDNSDLPDDCKDLIKTFLYEMQNPHLSPEKKTDKIKSFLTDISSGTISGVAASGLSTLLFHLLAQF